MAAKTSPVKDGAIVIPGDFLSPSEYTPGPGTHVRHGGIFSTLAGRVKVDPPVISVVSDRSSPSVPRVGSVVVGKIVNITEQKAKVSLMSVDGRLLQEPLHGAIRREDIRALEKDGVEMFQSFRPEDIVRARVISLGESQAYALSTAENELGVLLACSESGVEMVPVSWCELQCEQTGVREKRKVAKILNAIPVT